MAGRPFGRTIPPAVAAAMGLGEPSDIANLVVYLASDESRYVNGAAIAIDGGASAAAPATRPPREA